MKIRTTLLILTEVLALSAFANAAHADNDLQVWRDSDGKVVHNSWGGCVRSRWAINDDACAAVPVAQPVVWQRPVQPRTVVSDQESTVYFGFNKANLTAESRHRLDTLASRLTSAEDVEGAKIVGYADRIGTASYNDMLSKKRAETVRAYMVSQGFVKPSETETRWVGKTVPSAKCSAGMPHEKLVECLQPDRKVTVELMYKTTTTSSLDNQTTQQMAPPQQIAAQ